MKNCVVCHNLSNLNEHDICEDCWFYLTELNDGLVAFEVIEPVGNC